MKKNLHYLPSLISVNKKNYLRNLLFVVPCFVTAQLFSQNPLLLKSPIPGASGRVIEKIVATASGNAFFNTVDANNHFSSLWGLWTTDGTPEGTKKMTLTSPPVPTGTNSFISSEATLLTPLGNNKILFGGDDEGGYGEIWVSDGTQSGTFVLEQFFGSTFSGPPVQNITTFGNEGIYSVVTNDNKLQLHKTDGTSGGTAIVYDFGLYTDYSVAYFKTIGSLLYFELNNNTTTHNEIWRTDGTAAGTFQVKDLGQDYGFASDFMPFGGNIYFITTSSTYGDYIWKSDGTSGGTAPLKQISATFNYENLFPSYAATSTKLYFAANNSINGKELWKTDGTVSGTGMAQDQYVGSVGSNPNYLTVLNDKLYYTDNSSYAGIGNELNQYDGSLFIATDIFPGTTGSNISDITVLGNTLLFSAENSVSEGNEFWMSAGLANPLEIANINPGANLSSNPSLISVSGNSAYFVASFDANGDGIDDPCIYKYNAPEKIWIGSVSTDASDANNWFPLGVPSSSDNVLLPINATNPMSNLFLFCNDFINNGSTVNVGTGLCLFTGNFFNSGTINNIGGAGVFGMTGNLTSNHTFGTPGIYNGQFTISSNVNMHLTANSKINALRVEGGDTIFLEGYNFMVDNYPLFTPKIVANGSGSLYMPVGSSPVTFPLTNPVTITNNGAYDYFGVSVKDGLYKNGTSGSLITQQAVNKTWYIDELTQGGSNATITVQWNAVDELPGFDRNNVYLNHYTAGTWDSGTPGVTAGSGPYTFSRSGFTSFSPFSISSSVSVLPVTLISFNANKINNSVLLNWQTVSEKNASFYIIERSKDGNIFSKLGQVNASGNSSSANNYSYIDHQPLSGTNFYRLKIIDIDDNFTYSKIVALKMDDKNYTIQIFPNPAKDILNVQVNGNNENATLEMIDITGRKVKEEKITLNGNTFASININNLPKGTYTLLVKGKTINEQKKFIKE